MYLLDQHAAHERILYERYMEKFYRQDINMQILLDPVVIEVSNVDMLQIENNLELFMKFGFELEIFGNNHIMVRCVPTIFGVPETEKFILQIIDNIEEITSNYDLKGERFASMACRSAIKANDKIYDIEIKSLLEQLEKCENPFTCPHGRPIMVEISKTEIEKCLKELCKIFGYLKYMERNVMKNTTYNTYRSNCCWKNRFVNKISKRYECRDNFS